MNDSSRQTSSCERTLEQMVKDTPQLITKTSRTKAAIEHFHDFHLHQKGHLIGVDSSFARTLELELQSRTKELEDVCIEKQKLELENQELIESTKQANNIAAERYFQLTQLKAAGEANLKRAWHQKTCACLQNGKPINPLACDCGYQEALTNWQKLIDSIK